MTYDHWKSTEPDHGDEPMDEDDGYEAWRSGIIDRIKTWRDNDAPRLISWHATVGDYDLDDPIGRGGTENEAIQDLLDQLEPPR